MHFQLLLKKKIFYKINLVEISGKRLINKQESYILRLAVKRLVRIEQSYQHLQYIQ